MMQRNRSHAEQKQTPEMMVQAARELSEKGYSFYPFSRPLQNTRKALQLYLNASQSYIVEYESIEYAFACLHLAKEAVERRSNYRKELYETGKDIDSRLDTLSELVRLGMYKKTCEAEVNGSASHSLSRSKRKSISQSINQIRIKAKEIAIHGNYAAASRNLLHAAEVASTSLRDQILYRLLIHDLIGIYLFKSNNERSARNYDYAENDMRHAARMALEFMDEPSMASAILMDAASMRRREGYNGIADSLVKKALDAELVRIARSQ